ncbi:DUF4113 domain-containing protein [Paracoccus fontiphilus]|uniref:DUF4113 domain-containing protein n=1 Tax=Paracoccus fontiphilus TaxID=1815556 RepID=A0ABV7IAL4_9RHOB
MPAKAAPPDQAASPKFSHSSADHRSPRYTTRISELPTVQV